MKTSYLASAAVAVGLAGMSPSAACAEELAWKYEGTPTAAVVTTDTVESPALVSVGTKGATGETAEIDARWSCESILTGLTYRFKKFFTLFLR